MVRFGDVGSGNQHEWAGWKSEPSRFVCRDGFAGMASRSMVNDQWSIRLSKLTTADNHKQIWLARLQCHILKRLVPTVQFCHSAPLTAGMCTSFWRE
ncbi:hypothetical protein NSPZN2_90060 [Nitrospira defluvii]|uniref:Uncharacterized protein n=1 Tax=Nitrospira defluvii TaxID=330214 RepID=A0ABN7MII8_9BACT|nr:hypothetical protein NSPZN2_90060 [Nitrospira defluvii]